jgi:hypothetical protein
VECWVHTRDVCQGEYKGIAGMREISGLMLWRMAVKYREIYSWMMLTTIFLTTIYPQHALNRQLSEAAIEDYLRPISSDPQTAAKANLRCSTNDKQAARFNFLDEDQPLR